MTVLSLGNAAVSRQDIVMKLTPAIFLMSALFVASPAMGQDKAEQEDAVMGEEFCFPVKGVQDSLARFDGLKPKRLDTVGVDLALSLRPEPGEALPERIELRDQDQVMPISLDPKTYRASLTEIAKSASNDSSLCMVDPSRAGRMQSERGYGIQVGMGVRFLDTPGQHSIAQIEDGLDDGRAHYRKMAGVMGFMVPKFDHIAVAGQDPENPPRVWATRRGTDIGELDGFIFNNGRMIAMDTLDEMQADGIRIEGEYRLSPSPDAKTVEKFMQ